MKKLLLAGLTLAALPLAGGTALAQDNTYPLTLVDRDGVPFPLANEPGISPTVAQSPTEAVFLALDPDTPSGSYYVHVTDQLNGSLDRVLSLNDSLDRFVTVTNLGGGVILLSVPNNPGLVMGTGLGGLGDSLPLGLLDENPEDCCLFKAWIGDTFNLPVNPDNPYLLLTGGVRSYSYLRIGSCGGSSLGGVVFDDLNLDGVQDPGEPGLSGVTVELSGPGGVLSTVTAADGSWSFGGLPRGEYTAAQVVLPGRTATTASSFDRSAMGCGALEGGSFGQGLVNQNQDGHTIGFWRNKHGIGLVNSNGLLALLPSLNVVDANGAAFTTSSTSEYGKWLQKAEATNMAYMLSAQLVAMRFNVAVGFVGSGALVNDPNFGAISIQALMDLAVASLGSDPYTPTGHPQRGYQEQLKSALDGANNNSNWL